MAKKPYQIQSYLKIFFEYTTLHSAGLQPQIGLGIIVVRNCHQSPLPLWIQFERID